MADEVPHISPEGICLIEDPAHPGFYLSHTPNSLIEDPEYPGFYQISP